MNASSLFRLAFALYCLSHGMLAAAQEQPQQQIESVHVKPIRIGVSGPFTGELSLIGTSMREGIRIAAAEVNAAGGLLGRPVELVEYNDEARTERGAAIAQTMLNRDGIVAGLGTVNTGVALASQHYYQQARVPVINSAATGTLITRQFRASENADSFIFRVAPSDTVQAALMVEEAVDRRGFTRVAIFHDTTNYAQIGREDLERALDERGIRPVTVERFLLRQFSMTSQLERARSAGAQVVLVYGTGPGLARIANAMARLGWSAPLIGSWALAMPNFIENAGRDAEGARMPQTFIPDRLTPKRRAFLDAWRQRAGSERIPAPSAAAQGYDSMLLLAEAIRQANSTEGDHIRDALENLHAPVEGLIMTYNRPFSRDNHETITVPEQITMGEVRNGRVVFAYHEDRVRAAGR